MGSSASYVNAGIILVGYICQNSLFSYYFYCSLPHEKPERQPGHTVITTFNLLMATTFAFCVSEACIRNYSKMAFDPVHEYGVSTILINLLVAFVYENIAEYYWHRLLHWGPLYRTFHKYHHAYKEPEPFDDMYIHPLEAFCYYCILYAPPFLFRCHVYSFIGYMIIMGLCGTIDHSGVKVAVPGIYDASDHDRHHSKTIVNYAFPAPYMDIIHGTYDGTFLGIVITPRGRVGNKQR